MVHFINGMWLHLKTACVQAERVCRLEQSIFWCIWKPVKRFARPVLWEHWGVVYYITRVESKWLWYARMGLFKHRWPECRRRPWGTFILDRQVWIERNELRVSCATYNKGGGRVFTGRRSGWKFNEPAIHLFTPGNTGAEFVSPTTVFMILPIHWTGRWWKNILRRKEVRSAYGSAWVIRILILLMPACERGYLIGIAGKQQRYLYPSVSASMVFSELLKVAPHGKIRASFAQARSDIDIYQNRNSFAMREHLMAPISLCMCLIL